MRVTYRPRLVIKRYPESLDRDEVGVVYDSVDGEFYVCPPDLSSTSIEELTQRWLTYLRFVESIPSFELDKLFFVNPLQERALDRALTQFSQSENLDRSKLIRMFRSCERVV